MTIISKASGMKMHLMLPPGAVMRDGAPQWGKIVQWGVTVPHSEGKLCSGALKHGRLR